MSSVSFAALPSVPSGSLAGKEDKSAKGAVSGYAPLGVDSKVPAANLDLSAKADKAGATLTNATVDGLTPAEFDLLHLGAKATSGALSTVGSPAGSATLACPGMTSKTLTEMGGTIITAAAYVTTNSTLVSCVSGTNSLTFTAKTEGPALNDSTAGAITGTLLTAPGAMANGANPQSAARAAICDAVASDYAAGSRGLVEIETWAPSVNAYGYTFAQVGGFRRYLLALSGVGNATILEQMDVWPDLDIVSGNWRYSPSGVSAVTTGRARLFDDSGAASPSYPIAGIVDISPLPDGRMVVVPHLMAAGVSEGFRTIIGTIARPAGTLSITGRAADSFQGNVAKVTLYGERT
jgi:hypothetical protein